MKDVVDIPSRHSKFLRELLRRSSWNIFPMKCRSETSFWCSNHENLVQKALKSQNKSSTSQIAPFWNWFFCTRLWWVQSLWMSLFKRDKTLFYAHWIAHNFTEFSSLIFPQTNKENSYANNSASFEHFEGNWMKTEALEILVMTLLEFNVYND